MCTIPIWLCVCKFVLFAAIPRRYVGMSCSYVYMVQKWNHIVSLCKMPHNAEPFAITTTFTSPCISVLPCDGLEWGVAMVFSGRLDHVLFTLPSPLAMPQTSSSVLLSLMPSSGEAPLLKSPAAKLGRNWCSQVPRPQAFSGCFLKLQ